MNRGARTTVLMATVVAFGATMWLDIAPAHATCTVYSGGKVWRPGADPKTASLVVLDGRIASTPTTGCVSTALKAGAVITPGFVETATSMALMEIRLEDSGNDASAVGRRQNPPVPVRASYRAFDAYNPRSTLIPVARAEGVTHALTSPIGGLVSGQSALVRLRGRLQSDAGVLPSAAVAARIGAGAGSRGFKLQTLAALLDEAKRYLAAKTKRGGGLPAPVGSIGVKGTPYAYYAHLEAMAPVLTARQPLYVYADRASDLEALLRLQKRFGIKLVIGGASEGWLLAKELAAAKVAVVVDPTRYRPGSFDQIHARVDNAKRLVQAGVTVAVGTFSDHNVRRLRQMAGNAVRGGLTPNEALATITSAPRAAFGLPANTLAVGEQANLAVFDGDPLEPRSRLLALWIDGIEVSTDTRHKQLLKRYRNVAPPSGLGRPR